MTNELSLALLSEAIVFCCNNSSANMRHLKKEYLLKSAIRRSA